MKSIFVFMKRTIMCFSMLMVVNIALAQDFQTTHEVQRGETLSSIAKQYGVTEQMIKDANPQAGDLFYAGLKLNIPKLMKQDTNIQNEVSTEKKQIKIDEKGPISRQVKTSKKHEGTSYSSQFEQAANLNNKEYVHEFGTIGLGYWSYDGGENYGIQASHLAYNGWATEFNMRGNFKKYGNYNVDLALLGYSFGVTEFDNGALYLAFVAGPSMRLQTVYNWKDDEDTEKFFIDFYGAVSLNFKFGEKFLIKAGYNLWSAQFKFKKEYNADGVYVSLGYNF